MTSPITEPRALGDGEEWGGGGGTNNQSVPGTDHHNAM